MAIEVFVRVTIEVLGPFGKEPALQGFGGVSGVCVGERKIHRNKF